MAVLSKLKTSTKSKSNAGETSQQRLRRMLREKLFEQLELVEAELKGEQLRKTTIKYVPNKLTGEIVKQEVPRKLRKWYWLDQDGAACMKLLYGNIAIQFDGANTTFEAKSLPELPAAINLLLEAVEAGELDQALANAMEVRKNRMRGTKKG